MSRQTQTHEKILLVDDEEGIRKVLGIALSDMGYAVYLASCGEEALEILQREQPSVVLSDIKMPGMDGIKLLQKIKEIFPDTEVIMITGHGDLDLAIRSLKFEATDFITKPIHEDALEVALKRSHERIVMREKLREHTENLERLVEKKSRELVAAEKLAAVGETVAGLSHAIKNITGGLQGGTFVLEKGIELRDNTYLEKGWRMIKGNVDKIAKFSMDLLNYAKSVDIHYAFTDPHQPAKEVFELLKPRSEKEQITFSLSAEEGLPSFWMDPEGIFRVLLNMATNAFDACSAGCKKGEKPKIRMSSRRKSGWGVEYRIEDNGCGMDDGTRENLFQTFFSTKGRLGTGLGLMMSRNIVERHGGEIDVRSKCGVGTTFFVRIPLCTEPPREMPKVRQKKQEIDGQSST